jgi:hypothetical protein
MLDMLGETKAVYHGTGLLIACLEEDPLGTNTAQIRIHQSIQGKEAI